MGPYLEVPHHPLLSAHLHCLPHFRSLTAHISTVRAHVLDTYEGFMCFLEESREQSYGCLACVIYLVKPHPMGILYKAHACRLEIAALGRVSAAPREAFTVEPLREDACWTGVLNGSYDSRLNKRRPVGACSILKQEIDPSCPRCVHVDTYADASARSYAQCSCTCIDPSLGHWDGNTVHGHS
jgi:hypothetical protein